MQDRNYLLSITEFLEGENGAGLLKEAFCKVDSERRSKAERMRTDRGKAACLGAGLLLQLAVREAAEECGGTGCREAGEKIRREGVLPLQGMSEGSVGEGVLLLQGMSKSSVGEDVLPLQGMSEGSVGEDVLPLQGMSKSSVGEGVLPLQGMSEGGVGEGVLSLQGMSESNGQPLAAQAAERKLHRYSVSRLLERISGPIPLTFQYGKNGKPYFRDVPFYFNLSHSGDYVFCVLSCSEVGADIQQQCNKDNERLAERFFSAQEIAALRGCKEEKDALFYRLWTRKEAYGKLTGEGIAAAMGINFLPQAGQTVGDRKLLWEEYSEIPGYKLAVCRYAAHFSE